MFSPYGNNGMIPRTNDFTIDLLNRDILLDGMEAGRIRSNLLASKLFAANILNDKNRFVVNYLSKLLLLYPVNFSLLE